MDFLREKVTGIDNRMVLSPLFPLPFNAKFHAQIYKEKYFKVPNRMAWKSGTFLNRRVRVYEFFKAPPH